MGDRLDDDNAGGDEKAIGDTGHRKDACASITACPMPSISVAVMRGSMAAAIAVHGVRDDSAKSLSGHPVHLIV